MADSQEAVLTSTTIEALPKIAEGKVRTLYEVDNKTLLFVATDRISAYDVIMDNVSKINPYPALHCLVPCETLKNNIAIAVSNPLLITTNSF